MYSKEELLSNSVEQLKDIAKTIGAALTSKLRKEEIIYAILDKQAEVEGDTAPKRHRTRIVKKDTDRVYSVNGTDGENFDSKKNKIQANADSPTIFSEQDIANELNLSRTPVHEAMQELSSTKIIEILPQRGSHVSLIDMAHVEEAVFIRATIESAVTEMACKQATEQDLQEMEENVALQRFYYEKNNLDRIMELDNAFHEIMYKITNKMQCHYMVRLMSIHYDRIRELNLHSFNPE